MLANAPARRVESVKTAIELVNTLQRLGRATPAQLTRELDLSKSSVHNYLGTLETEGYVVNDDGVYRLGLRFLTHGAGAKKALTIEQSVLDTVASVAETFSRTACWITEESGRGYVIERSAVEDGPRYGSLGKRSYLHTNAPGKAVLALADDEYVDAVCDQHGLPERTRKTTTDRETLREELDAIRERGFAVSDGEAMLGIVSIGVAFRDVDDRRHAIGVFDHSRNLAGTAVDDVGRRLVEIVGDLERRICGEDR
jgi:DNA-binding IclR family transcriptional regulator